MRRYLLQRLYALFPFDVKGDCSVAPGDGTLRISCVINFYGRLNLLEGILSSLSEQNFNKKNFEVLLIEDKGGTEAGQQLTNSFATRLPIRYLPLDDNFGKMGYARNFGLARTRGEIVLFLDDDTVLLQHDFLTLLDRIFLENPGADAVVPHGHASFSLLEDRYAFHDPYFMTSRCTAYRLEVLRELGGFMEHFVGQEDVEFVTRFTIAGNVAIKTDTLHYYHPPLLVPNTRKPRAVGYSFFGLRGRYSWPIWLLLLLNCARHAPLFFLPIRRCREQGRFGIGFLGGVFDALLGKKGQVYG